MSAADLLPANDVARKQELLHALACAAEDEGRLDAAIALARWADSLAAFAPLPMPEGRRARKGGGE